MAKTLAYVANIALSQMRNDITIPKKTGNLQRSFKVQEISKNEVSITSNTTAYALTVDKKAKTASKGYINRMALKTKFIFEKNGHEIFLDVVRKYTK